MHRDVLVSERGPEWQLWAFFSVLFFFSCSLTVKHVSDEGLSRGRG